MILDCPAAEIEIDDLLSREGALVEQIGEKHRDGSIGADEPYHPELNTLGSFALLAAEPPEKVVGRGDGDVVFRQSTSNKGLNGREGGFGRTAE
jgi:hypothetical protein